MGQLRIPRTPDCHPSRRHHAKGLCRACYVGGKARIKYFNSDEARAIAKVKAKERWDRRRKLVFKHYGEFCACCGEDQYEFLTIDHINGGGNLENRKDRTYLHWRLIAQGFPPGFQTLCWNCNCAKGQNKFCPHEKRLRLILGGGQAVG